MSDQGTNYHEKNTYCVGAGRRSLLCGETVKNEKLSVAICSNGLKMMQEYVLDARRAGLFECQKGGIEIDFGI